MGSSIISASRLRVISRCIIERSDVSVPDVIIASGARPCPHQTCDLRAMSATTELSAIVRHAPPGAVSSWFVRPSMTATHREAPCAAGWACWKQFLSVPIALRRAVRVGAALAQRRRAISTRRTSPVDDLSIDLKVAEKMAFDNVWTADSGGFCAVLSARDILMHRGAHEDVDATPCRATNRGSGQDGRRLDLDEEVRLGE